MDMTLYDPLPTYKDLPTLIFELGIHIYIRKITFEPLIYLIRLSKEKSKQIAAFINGYFYNCVYKLITAPQNKAKRSCARI
jgi:hypothetical protein